MSVLYKALQKAEKENEQRQAASGIDAERLAGSGAIRQAGGRRVNWRIAGGIMVIVFMGFMGAVFYITTMQGSGSSVVIAPPAPPPPAAPPATSPAAPAEAPAAPQVAQVAPATPAQSPPPASETSAPAAAAPTAEPAVSPAPTQTAAATPAATPPAATPPEAKSAAPVAAPSAPSAPQVAEATPPAAPAAAPTAANPPAATQAPAARAPAPKPASREPMPQIAADSPARMLSPPISVKREQFALSGVGNIVQVRQVSAEARNDVSGGYSALLRGDYGAALQLYDQALKAEPTSVMALLGRGAASQKLGRSEEARLAYEAVLKSDPTNREALTNLTGLVAEREPGEALKRLQGLEAEYPNFSPIKAQIGLIYAKLEQWDPSLEYLQHAIAMTPDAAMYHYDLAIVLDRMSLREQAVVAYRHVLALLDRRDVPELSRPAIERRLEFLSVQ